MPHFDLEYEVLMKNLKSDFLACKKWELYCGLQYVSQNNGHAWLRTLQERYRVHLAELQQQVRRHFHLFDARRTSSLLGIPTRQMEDGERLIHRIWMGGSLPPVAAQAVSQWQAAIDDVMPADDFHYGFKLWVWDGAQLHGDPAFTPDAGPDYQLGHYAAGRHVHRVCSLEALAARLAPAQLPLLRTLHAQRYFVNLADFFRLLILQEYGGIYVDVDTMPYKSATIFLAKPEVPDYTHFRRDGRTGKLRRCVVSWMNLINDENGVLVAKKNDPSVRAIVRQMCTKLLAMPSDVPDKRLQPQAARRYATALHDATYGVWKESLGESLVSYDAIAQAHSVLHEPHTETMISGVHGMRLVVDAFTNAPVPLDQDEQRSYETCIATLEARGWQLEDAMELERLVHICRSEEVPRMAYAPQLRAEPASCHYYSFLSDDEKLDRVNALFGAYLISKNAAHIERGNFWRKTRGHAHTEGARQQ
ncbi:glycosyltransferase [Janthinobacterium sp. Mn2066]|uniref:glycosyltransferase n=1 Tax=Janthinobacterium sp. Mn2066 TaxID=3395264 RepID=UPI003BEE7071